VAAEIPEWLRELAPAAEAEAALPVEEGPLELPAEAPVAAEVPEWLRELAPAAEAEVALPVEEAPLELPAEAPVAAEVPEWLRELEPAAEVEAVLGVEEGPLELAAEAPVAAEVPEWLRELEPAAEAEAALPVEEGPLELAAEAPVAAEVPEWLPEAAALAPHPAAPVEMPVTEEMPVAELPPVPDWLRDLGAVEAGQEGLAAPVVMPAPLEPAAEIGVPDWLLTLAAEPSVEIEGLPGGPESDEAWLAALEAELAQVVDLEELKSQRLVLPPAEEAEVAQVAPAELERAEIPEWLGALRPGLRGAGAAEVAALGPGEPVVGEGILEGLAGVLPLAPVIEVPPVYRPRPPAAASEASLARAQLLQGLIAKAPELARVELQPRARPTVPRLQRLLVLVVLALMVVGAMIAPYWTRWLPPLVQLPSALPAADRLYAAIDGLQAGDTVLVAFEYGSAEADEMDVVAEPVLRHLLERGVRPIVVSTRPEGQMAGVALLERIAGPAAEPGEVPYQLPAGSTISPETCWVWRRCCAGSLPRGWCWSWQARLHRCAGGSNRRAPKVGSCGWWRPRALRSSRWPPRTWMRAETWKAPSAG
jgi:hypothetical protein